MFTTIFGEIDLILEGKIFFERKKKKKKKTPHLMTDWFHQQHSKVTNNMMIMNRLIKCTDDDYNGDTRKRGRRKYIWCTDSVLHI